MTSIFSLRTARKPAGAGGRAQGFESAGELEIGQDAQVYRTVMSHRVTGTKSAK